MQNRNNYLYKTKVEDWGDNCHKIWRLSLLLKPEEWAKVKPYFKYYKNRNLVGWGTTNPLEVTEILLTLRGTETDKEELKSINDKLEEIRQSRLNGYGQWHDFDWGKQEEDDYNESLLKNQKKELLGLI